MAIQTPFTQVALVQSPGEQDVVPTGTLVTCAQEALPSFAPGEVMAKQEVTHGLRIALQVPSDKQSASGCAPLLAWKYPKRVLQYPFLVDPTVTGFELVLDAGVT